MTLDDIIQKEAIDKGLRPDEIKVRLKDWLPYIYFTPYFKSNFNTWVGLTVDRRTVAYDENVEEEIWQLYAEPKKKKVLKQFAYLTKQGAWKTIQQFYTSKESFENDFTFPPENVIETGVTIEVEDE